MEVREQENEDAAEACSVTIYAKTTVNCSPDSSTTIPTWNDLQQKLFLNKLSTV
jgi:hypothetical protein